MKHRLFAFLLSGLLLVSLTACAGEGNSSSKSTPLPSESSQLSSELLKEEDPTPQPSPAPASAGPTAAPESVFSAPGAEEELLQITINGQVFLLLQITINGQVFFAELEDNASASAFAEMLPISLMMKETGENTMGFELPASLPEDPVENSSALREGQLILEGASGLRLVYGAASAGSYTPLALVEDPKGMEQALSDGEAEVSFQMGGQ